MRVAENAARAGIVAVAHAVGHAEIDEGLAVEMREPPLTRCGLRAAGCQPHAFLSIARSANNETIRESVVDALHGHCGFPLRRSRIEPRKVTRGTEPHRAVRRFGDGPDAAGQAVLFCQGSERIAVKFRSAFLTSDPQRAGRGEVERRDVARGQRHLRADRGRRFKVPVRDQARFFSCQAAIHALPDFRFRACCLPNAHLIHGSAQPLAKLRFP